MRLAPSSDDQTAAHAHESAEVDLVRRAQLGSGAAFEQLVLRRGPDLYRYLVARLHDEGEARDALQETLTAAWLALPSLKETRKLWPWLVGIAAHKAADARRGRARAGVHELRAAPLEDETLLELRDALAALPERFREVLLLRYFLDLSEEEVAEALGVRVGTVKSRSARARRALMDQLR